MEDDFHGETMAWSHHGRETNRRLMKGAGFEIVFDEIATADGEVHQVPLACVRDEPVQVEGVE